MHRNRDLNVLGIESTAHTLGIGVFSKSIKSNELDMFKPSQRGFIPRELADHHANIFADVLDRALNKANITLKDVDLIAVSQGPGIGAPLSFGVSMAKFLAKLYKKEIVGVNHPLAHIKIGEYDTGLKHPLVVYVSGGNTQILYETKPFIYKIMGETLDMGIGNLFDSFARKAGLEKPHGSELEKIAKKGKYIELPYYVKGMNISYSGLYTAAIKALKTHPLEDVVYSLMETAFAMTVEVAERALHVVKAKAVLVCGGVAQNKRLQQMLKEMAKENGIEFGVARDEFNRDNGAMIAYTGLLQYDIFGPMDINTLIPLPNYRIDKIKDVLM